MTDIRTFIKENGPLLFDGAMGTCFAALPGRAEQRCELANLTDPGEIANLHRAYLDAGCRAIKTNTFTAGVDLAQGRGSWRRRSSPPPAALPGTAPNPVAPMYSPISGPRRRGRS